MLVSKTMVDGLGGGAGRYSAQQRQRLYRVGIREFFRLDAAGGPRIATIGDCGGFSYILDDVPPYSVDEVIDFYDECGFDAGLSVDHVILGFGLSPSESDVPAEWSRRQALTIDLAVEFISRHRERHCSFEPVGVAQGWSPASYAVSVAGLQDAGYQRIALGGLVAQKTHEIITVLRAISEVRRPETEFHLLGVTRCEHVAVFRAFGVTSFDSTSPFRQAFKDDRDNYYDDDRTWTALRVPQVEGNAKLQRRISSGEVDQSLARRLEQRALNRLAEFDRGEADVDETVAALRAYERVHDEKRDRSPAYAEVLQNAPWKSCSCAVCRVAGIHVMIFRGSERNKRRGFHNLGVFARRLDRGLACASGPPVCVA
jgi:hypothetical protein